MKKYRQVLVWAVLLIGITGFFLYRNEYVKLRSTFEMFVVVDSSSGFSDRNCLVLNETGADDGMVDALGRPRPLWTPVGRFHVYSAFAAISGGRSLVKAIAVGKAEDSTRSFRCHIWYDFKDVILSSTEGEFAIASERIDTADEHFYELTCSVVEEVKGRPYMLVLVDPADGRKYFVPVFRPPPKADGFSAALCVYPDLTGLPKTFLVEFLAFHQVVGFTDVLLYDFGLHYGLLDKAVRMASASRSFRSFSVLNWNLPYLDSRVAKFLLQKDCLYRTADRAAVTVALGWNEYLVPKNAAKLDRLFANHTVLKNTKIDLRTRLCCTDKKNTKGSEKSWPRVLRKTECAAFPTDSFVIINPTMSPPGQTARTTVEKGTIFFYDNCYNYGSVKATFNPTALDFLGELMSNKILRLWKSGKFFS